MPQFDQERVELARAVQNDLAQERTFQSTAGTVFRALHTDHMGSRGHPLDRG